MLRSWSTPERAAERAMGPGPMVRAHRRARGALEDFPRFLADPRRIVVPRVYDVPMTKHPESEATFATSAHHDRSLYGGGDATMYRSPVRSDGSAAILSYRAPVAVMLLDTRTGCPWLMVDVRGAEADPFAMAPAPYLGALATVLSEMVAAADDAPADDATIVLDSDDGRQMLTHAQALAMCETLAAELGEDGATTDLLPDGRIVRLRVEVDESTTIDDYADCYGRIVWCDDRDRHAPRPAGMDGNAEKLGVGRGYDRCWWQPSPDGPRRGTDAFRAERAHLLDLLDRGFVGYVVEVCDAETDAYGDLVVRESASLWGIDALDVDAEMVAELVWEALGF